MQLIEQYIAAWNTTDAAARKELVGRVFTPEATYTDPMAQVAGHDEIDALVAQAQGMFPGLEFTLAGPVDALHDVARFAWNLGPRGGEPVVVGFDVAVIADGRIDKVHGFLDRVPS